MVKLLKKQKQKQKKLINRIQFDSRANSEAYHIRLSRLLKGVKDWCMTPAFCQGMVPPAKSPPFSVVTGAGATLSDV